MQRVQRYTGKRAMLAAVLGSGIALTATVGCETAEPTAILAGAGAGVLAGGIASAAGAGTGEAALIGAGAGLLAGAITYAVVRHHEVRRAEQQELARAREEAARREATKSETQQKAIQEHNAKHFVAVEEDEEAVRGVLIDPKTNRPVDGKVYEVPKKEIENLDTVEVVHVPRPAAPTSPDDAPADEEEEVVEQEVKFGQLGSHRAIFHTDV